MLPERVYVLPTAESAISLQRHCRYLRLSERWLSLVSLGRLKNEQRQFRRVGSGARLPVQRAERVASLGCAVGCFRARLSRAVWVENGFVGYVARGHGRCVFAQRLPLRSRSLPLHGTIFHPWRSYFSGLRPRASAAWTIRVELDWPRNNHRSNRLHLGPRTVSRSISTGRIQRGLTRRCSRRLPRLRFQLRWLKTFTDFHSRSREPRLICSRWNAPRKKPDCG